LFFLQQVSPLSLSLVNAYRDLALEHEKQERYVRSLYPRALIVLEQRDVVARLGRNQVDNCLEILRSHPSSDWKLDSLVHADLHPGNVLKGLGRNNFRVVDWENITVGNAFFDLLFCAKHFCLFPDFYKSALSFHEKQLGRELERNDFAQPLSFLLISLQMQIDSEVSTEIIRGLNFLIEHYELMQRRPNSIK